MIFKLSVVLSVVALSTSYPVSYVTSSDGQAQQQRLQPAPPAQYRYVQQAAQPAQYQAQPQAQYQAQPQYQPQQVAYQQPQAALPQRPRKLRPQAPLAQQRIPIGADGNPSSAQDQEYDANPAPYQFSFDVRDDLSTNYQNRKEEREGDKITGSYSVVDSDGFIRTVKYTADPIEGFKAEVTREPTDIKVLIPTPPPQQLSPRQQHTQQYLEAAPQFAAPQQQQYARRPAPRAPARSQYAEPPSAPQQQYAAAPSAQPAQYAAPARAGKTAAYFTPQQAPQQYQ